MKFVQFLVVSVD